MRSLDFAIRPLVILSAIAALLLAGCVMPPKPYKKPAAPSKPVQTGKFWWGTSTASFQNEDRGVAPGSPHAFKTDWDIFAEEGHIPPRGDEATFSWTHFDKDLAALKKLGVNHYRFGIEWGRVEPKPGVFNEKAIAQYVLMAKKLRAAGIEPIVTLWHFTFPSWMVAKGRNSRWLHPLYRERWPLYVEKVVKAMAPHVKVYAPQNEPNGDLALGYISATWPPGYLLSFGTHAAALEESVWGFRKAAEIVRSHRKDALILSIAALPYWERGIFDPTGAYYNLMQRINYTHLDKTFDVCDLIGFNYYYTEYPDFTALLAIKLRRGRNYSLLGWIIQPRSLYKQIRNVQKRYNKPVVITENGIATSKDVKRVRYLFNHILEVKEAIHDGADVRGYFVWTLVDNYEWHQGYKAPFGMAKFDRSTMKRLLRPSALFYRGIIDSSKASSILDDVSTAPELPPGFVER
jgi:beta-glucosidase